MQTVRGPFGLRRQETNVWCCLRECDPRASTPYRSNSLAGRTSGHAAPGAVDVLMCARPRVGSGRMVCHPKLALSRGIASQLGRRARVTSDSAGPPVPTQGRERAQLAGNRSAPAHLLRAISVDAGLAVRKALAENPSSPQDVLVTLARDEHRGVRWAVALNPSAPEEALMALVSDPYNQVRWTVPMHKNCTPRVQRAVAASQDSMARQNLAGRELADEVTATLAVDPDPQVRRRLASWTRDSEVLARLMTDPSEVVRAGATENRALSREQMLALARDLSRRVRGQLAVSSSVDLPLEVLEVLARDRSVDVRFALTGSPQPESIARILYNDPHPDVAGNMDQWRSRGRL